ncbi:MAG: glucosaminidase domain-containing protein, partial [Verrucomicrobiota bacterium]
MKRPLVLGRRVDLKWVRGIDREDDVNRRRLWLGALCVVVLVMAAFFAEPFIPLPMKKPDEPLPDFKAIESIAERKRAFFDFLAPLVEEVNIRLLQERSEIGELEAYFQRKGKLSEGRLEKLNEIRVRYDFEEVTATDAETFKDLLSRVDVIPPSLALAQAAVESGWGTSRFAREGNNLFGMWCYQPGCGIVPARRPAGATHEVTRYASPRESFEAYIHNLN